MPNAVCSLQPLKSSESDLGIPTEFSLDYTELLLLCFRLSQIVFFYQDVLIHFSLCFSLCFGVLLRKFWQHLLKTKKKKKKNRKNG